MSESPKVFIPMIKRVSIKNFKGIRNCEIQDIGKVNLFIGKNGCGKSSIMEALFYAGKEFVGNHLPECIQRRVERQKWNARELWYAYEMNSDIDIRLGFGMENFVAVKIARQNGQVSVSARSGDSKTISEYNFVSRYTNHLISQARGQAIIHNEHAKEIMEYFGRSIFIDPTLKSNVVQIEVEQLNKIELSESSREYMMTKTAETYQTKPNWGFIPHPDLSPNDPSRFTIFDGDQRLFLDNFGDGLRFGLAIMARAKNSKNTALFIEEIESHQHPGAVGKLISNLVEIARMNNLQLFITTHSRIVWNFLINEFENENARQRLLRVYRVVRNGETGVVKCISQTKKNANEFWSAVDKDLYGPLQK